MACTTLLVHTCTQTWRYNFSSNFCEAYELHLNQLYDLLMQVLINEYYNFITSHEIIILHCTYVPVTSSVTMVIATIDGVVIIIISHSITLPSSLVLNSGMS